MYYALLRRISVTVFNFTRPPVLSALLLILSASRFLVAGKIIGLRLELNGVLRPESEERGQRKQRTLACV